MNATLEQQPRIYALEPVDELCETCQQSTVMRVIVIPPAVANARATLPLHSSVLLLAKSDDDDLANATWEDAAWQ